MINNIQKKFVFKMHKYIALVTFILISACSSSKDSARTSVDPKGVSISKSSSVSDVFLTCAALSTRGSKESSRFTLGNFINTQADSTNRGVNLMLLSTLYRASFFNSDIVTVFYDDQAPELLTLQGVHSESNFTPPDVYISGGVTEISDGVSGVQRSGGVSYDRQGGTTAATNDISRVSVDLHGIAVENLELLPRAYSSTTVSFETSDGVISTSFSVLGAGVSFRRSYGPDVSPDEKIRIAIDIATGVFLMNYHSINPAGCVDRIENMETYSKRGAAKIIARLQNNGIDLYQDFLCDSEINSDVHELGLEFFEHCSARPQSDGKLMLDATIASTGRLPSRNVTLSDFAILDMVL